MPGKPGEVRKWEFVKIRVWDDGDAEHSAVLMEDEGWKYICCRDGLSVMKRRDGKTKIKLPDLPKEPDSSARLGDLIYV